MNGLPAWTKGWITTKTLWHQQVGDSLYLIDSGSEKYPFSYQVLGKDRGQGGPAQSFEEAMENIRTILNRKGMTLPKRKNRLPGFGS